MSTIQLRPFGPAHRYRGPLTISVDQPTRGEQVVVLSGALEQGHYRLRIEAASIEIPTDDVQEDDYGPYAVVREQQLKIPGGVLNVEKRGEGEALVEILGYGGEPLHIYFEFGHYDAAGRDFDSPGPGSPPPPVRRPRR